MKYDRELDFLVRQSAFDFLKAQEMRFGELLPRIVLQKGFNFRGERVALVSPQQGIFKPRILTRFPLSILTAPIKEGRPRPYEDELLEDGTIRYKYRGQDPSHRDNVGLRSAMEERVPLIYFYGVAPGLYLPFWPVFIVGDNPETLTFSVQVDESGSAETSRDRESVAAEGRERRRYITVAAQKRMHQQSFRARVLRAYHEQCSVCRLRHAELLEAAHIIPDSDPRGLPEVPNGLALCKLHHAAFDGNVIGIRPDHSIQIRRDILEEEDGPMLRHGLQGFQNQLIHVPRSAALKPNQDYLAERYRVFLSA